MISWDFLSSKLGFTGSPLIKKLAELVASSLLVGGSATPLKNMSPSIGMMRFPIYWENKKWQPNHQPIIHESETKYLPFFSLWPVGDDSPQTPIQIKLVHCSGDITVRSFEGHFLQIQWIVSEPRCGPRFEGCHGCQRRTLIPSKCLTKTSCDTSFWRLNSHKLVPSGKFVYESSKTCERKTHNEPSNIPV